MNINLATQLLQLQDMLVTQSNRLQQGNYRAKDFKAYYGQMAYQMAIGGTQFTAPSGTNFVGTMQEMFLRRPAALYTAQNFRFIATHWIATVESALNNFSNSLGASSPMVFQYSNQASDSYHLFGQTSYPKQMNGIVGSSIQYTSGGSTYLALPAPIDSFRDLYPLKQLLYFGRSAAEEGIGIVNVSGSNNTPNAGVSSIYLTLSGLWIQCMNTVAQTAVDAAQSQLGLGNDMWSLEGLVNA